MIVEALRDLGRPVGAYELMDRLREKVSPLAPPTVYRSLDRLVAGGRAHRLHSLNAFIACRHLSHKGAAVFAICRCSSERSSRMNTSSGWRSSVKKLPPLARLDAKAVVSMVAIFLPSIRILEIPPAPPAIRAG